jgi:NhaP-type Na+/H+ or K+/H+ antiporter
VGETLVARQVMFFANMGAILSYGLLGTLVTFFFISVGVSSAFQIMSFDKLYDEGPSLRDTLTLGATFCATDSIAILQILSQVCASVVALLAGAVTTRLRRRASSLQAGELQPMHGRCGCCVAYYYSPRQTCNPRALENM